MPQPRSSRTALASLLLLLAATLGGCRHGRPEVPPQVRGWPVPPGWKHETLPFPLAFAPGLPYRGVEELRFPPGFFDAASPNYWSYAFVWWLEGRPALAADALAEDLTRYFRGLSLAVGGKRHRLDRDHFRTTLTEDAPPTPREGQPVRRLRGSIDSYDAFTTGRALTLAVEVLIWDCPAAARRVALFTLSPQPPAAEIWQRLAERQSSFTCR